jgi:predicted transcriptional regulator
MNITVTITLSPEVQSLLTDLVDVLKKSPSSAAAKASKQTAPEPEVEEPEAPKTNGKAKPKEESKKAATSEVTAELVRSVTTDKIQGGKRAEVKELLMEFGVGKLTELEEGQLGAFYAKVREL